MNEHSFDVIVIGGGAAGLSGALTLARARRSVAVIDAGEPRNAPAAGVHGFLSRDGIAPADLVVAGTADVTRYGGQVVRARASDIDGSDGSDSPGGPGFVVGTDDGRTFTARRLLVTTGLVDELPDIPGLRERWGRDVLHCPYCHGWEVRDEPIGVLGTGPFAVHQALLFRQWSPDVILFVHSAPAPSPEEREQLAAREIDVIDGEVAALEVSDGRLTGVRLVSGRVVPRRAVTITPRFVARSGVLSDLGLAAVEDPRGIGHRIEADATGLTSAPGVWVAGNVTDLTAQVIAAAAAAVTAAAAINADLIADETRRAVERRRAAEATPEAHDGHAAVGHPEGSHPDSSHPEGSHPSSGHVGVGHAEDGHAEDGHAEDGHVQGGHAGGSAMDEHFTAQFWDERYRSATRIWSGNPNPQLVRETSDLTPGSALDAGCGEGADTHWLARRGWQVTAVDVSAVGIERGAAHAAQNSRSDGGADGGEGNGKDIGKDGDQAGKGAGAPTRKDAGAATGKETSKNSTEDGAGRISWLQADLRTWIPGENTFDLVNVQFMHFPRALREPIFARLAAAVSPGGTLLVVGHDPSDLTTTMQRPHEPDLFFTAEEVAASLDPDRWDVVVAESRPRSASDPDGRQITIHDAVLHARRRR